MKRLLTLLISLLILTCCKQEPKSYSQVSQQPDIFPDYTDITIPYNIAPLNFYVKDADRVILLIIGGDKEYRFSYNSSFVKFNSKKWREMLKAERGNTLELLIRAIKGEKEYGYRSFTWRVAPEAVDRYLSYRLIEPAYEVWNMLSVCERDVESFKERVLADNAITDHSCINCHTSNRSANPSTFMHVRGKRGGTIYSSGGVIRKMNTATPSTSGSAVYGELSADGRYGIFTTANIIPALHSAPLGRLEVYDKSSDLILLDFQENVVTDSPLVKGSEFQETFPCFSADNKTIYFCRADYHPQPDSTEQMHYDLCSISFEDGELGDTITTLIDAKALGKSISFPKSSPDGKYILITVSDYGTFPIWHTETDLWMYEIATGKIDKMERANGQYSDSYHCWSTNSKWIVWASKRGDRVYGRPYYAYVNENGEVSKPFVLPQKDPEYYITTTKSFNIPEMYNTRELYGANKIGDIYFDSEAETMNYR